MAPGKRGPDVRRRNNGESSGLIRILVIDDHPLIVQGIRCALESFDEMRIVGEAYTEDDAFRLVKAHQPDIILLDFAMPERGGLEIAKLLRKESPGANTIFLSIDGKKDPFRAMTFSGAKGYLLQEAPSRDLVRAINAVHAGGTFFSPAVSAAIAGPAVHSVRRVEAPRGSLLTARETEILSLIADGFSNKGIAARLGVGVRTVETHRGRLMGKLDIRTTAGLTKYAVSKGLSKLPDPPCSCP